MKIRRYTALDATIIDQIHSKYKSQFSLPKLENTIESAVVEIEDKIVAYGGLELIPEAILILDDNISKSNKAIAIRELMNTAITAARLNNYDRIIATPDTEKYGKLLIKHFGLEKLNTLIKRLD